MQSLPPDQIALVLDTLHQVFPGEMRDLQAALTGFDTARAEERQTQPDATTLPLLTTALTTRLALQTSVMRLGFSIVYAVLLSEACPAEGKELPCQL